MKFILIPVKNLKRRPLRSFLTALGIAVAVAGFIALVGLSQALERAWINSLIERDTHMLAVRKGAVEILTASIDQNLGNEIVNIKGVRDVAAELVDLVTLESGQPILLTGWLSDSYLWKTLQLNRGRLPASGEANRIVIGQTIADALEKEPGDAINIHNKKFFVTGIFKQAGVMGNNTIILLLSAMQSLAGKPGRVTEFNLRLDHPDNPLEVAAVRSRLSEAFPNLVFTETNEIADNNEILRLLRAMAWGTSMVALLMALVVILNTVLMSITERTSEIGILKALGWQGSRIVGLIMLEGLCLAVIGSFLGIVLGINGLNWLSDLPRVRGFLEPDVTPSMVLEISALAIFIGVLGSAYPAWRAARLNTVDALRYE